MGFLTEMYHYVNKNKDGLYHVQNTVGMFFGQHHVHTKESYDKWKKNGKIKAHYIKIMKGECDCGLKPGYVKDHNDNISKLG